MKGRAKDTVSLFGDENSSPVIYFYILMHIRINFYIN